MLAEFWNALRKTAEDAVAVKPTVFKQELQVDPREIVYWDPEKKRLDRLAVSPDLRRHVVSDVQSLAILASAHCDSVTNTASVMMTVWVGDREVRLVFDHDDRRDWATLPLVKTNLWELLEKLAKQPVLSQSDAIRLLRQDLAEFDLDQKALLAARNVRIRGQTDDERVQNVGNAKMSRSIQAEALGAHLLPETLKLHVQPFEQSPPFEAPPNGYPLTLWLEVDLERVAIRMEPDAAEMRQTLVADRDRLIEKIQEVFEAEGIDANTFRVVAGVC